MPTNKKNEPPTLGEWQALPPHARARAYAICLRAIHRPAWPVILSLLGSCTMLALLVKLPAHPLSIPTAVGTGLAVVLWADLYGR